MLIVVKMFVFLVEGKEQILKCVLLKRGLIKLTFLRLKKVPLLSIYICNCYQKIWASQFLLEPFKECRSYIKLLLK